MNEINGFAMDWDDILGVDEKKVWQPLDEGDYDFKVVNFERGRFPGSAKIGACNKAIITIEVNGQTVKSDLLLWDSLKWKISSFFICLGMKKHNEELKMDWGNVVGKTGKCHITIREYQSNGETKRTNDVSKWLEPVASSSEDFEL